MTTANTKTTTYTSTLQKIIYVTKKVQADFLAILDSYGYFSEKYATEIINDIRVFLDEGVISKIKFVWTEKGINNVLEELDYIVIANGIGLSDERSGGICYRPELAKANFHVRVIYNERWPELRDEIVRENLLKLKWGSAGDLNYSGGKWFTERTYCQDGYGLTRSRFTL